MDLIQFALEPRDGMRSPEECEESKASDREYPVGSLISLISVAVLLLFHIIFVGSFAAHQSRANVGELSAIGEPSSEADELIGLIPRGWQ
jgi:hypothetical protein